MISPLTLRDANGAINWAGLSGAPLSDIVNALYLFEVEQQLQLHLDALLSKEYVDELADNIATVIVAHCSQNPGTRASGKTKKQWLNGECGTGKTIAQWLEELRDNPVPLRRARSQAALALSPGFWRAIDGATWRVDHMEIDPLRHYGIRGVAWDHVSHPFLAHIETTFLGLRDNWLVAAAGQVIQALDREPLLFAEGVDGEHFDQEDKGSVRIARRVFEESNGFWLSIGFEN